MPLKKAEGNMYGWVGFTHAHLGGECPHRCRYCYVDNPRFGRPPKYTGDIRLIEDEFKVAYGSGKTIFIENCNDLWAHAVPETMIRRVLAHCNTWPDNKYVFQTKNPIRYREFEHDIPARAILGTTIETNRPYPQTIGLAPSPKERMEAMRDGLIGWSTFLTIEPVMDFDVDELAQWVIWLRPQFLNIGADSKNKGLPEPTKEKILAFVAELRKGGIEVREKHNLKRILET